MDWNWFFSTFSQSAAALLGVIAAFIIARLLGLDERTGMLRHEFDGLKVDKIKIERRLARFNILDIIHHTMIAHYDVSKMTDAKYIEDNTKDVYRRIYPLTIDEAQIIR